VENLQGLPLHCLYVWGGKTTPVPQDVPQKTTDASRLVERLDAAQLGWLLGMDHSHTHI
jgi:hypothetical protein